MPERVRQINIFGGLQLDRQAEQRDDADWLSAHRSHPNACYLLLRHDGRALVHCDHDDLRLLDSDESAAFVDHANATFLGSDDARPYFLLTANETQSEAIGSALSAVFLDLRSAGLRLHPFQAGLFSYARALAYWQARTRFCPVCGASLQLLAAGHRARCSNPECATEQFPRTDAAIIVIVRHGERCLLGRQATWPERRYSTLAGFVEPGETLEDAVRREVFEEAGVRVGECEYFSSQPWPFPASLMIGFHAQADDPHIRCGAELSDARWFSVDDIVRGLATRELVLSPPLSVAYRLIEDWLRETGGLELSGLMHDEPFRPTA
ncbi:MAG: NAD(+) diphosphatase [Dokdonella sp.]